MRWLLKWHVLMVRMMNEACMWMSGNHGFCLRHQWEITGSTQMLATPIIWLRLSYLYWLSYLYLRVSYLYLIWQLWPTNKVMILHRFRGRTWKTCNMKRWNEEALPSARTLYASMESALNFCSKQNSKHQSFHLLDANRLQCIWTGNAHDYHSEWMSETASIEVSVHLLWWVVRIAFEWEVLSFITWNYFGCMK